MRRFGRRHRKGDSHLASNDAVTALELGERVGTLHTRELDDDVSVALMRGSAWAACGSRAGTNTPIPTEADAIPEEAARPLYSAARLGYWTRVAEYELDADAHAEADFIDFLRPLVVERRYGTQVLDNAAYVSAGWGQ